MYGLKLGETFADAVMRYLMILHLRAYENGVRFTYLTCSCKNDAD